MGRGRNVGTHSRAEILVGVDSEYISRRIVLEERLRELLSRTCGGTGQPPVPSGLVIAEERKGIVVELGRILLSRSELKTPEEYVPRFERLMSTGYVWLNMNFCGFLNGRGLVLVEFPRLPSARRGDEPVPRSVIYSGPMRFVRDAGWDASAFVTLV